MQLTAPNVRALIKRVLSVALLILALVMTIRTDWAIPEVLLDSDASANLILRHRRTADRIAPFGMRGTKLVSDLMTHLRLSPTQKRAAWLVEAGGTVVWVVGYRAARQTEVQPGSRDYIILRVKD